MNELQKLLSKTRRACEHYEMIRDGDKIAVGVSGGKDSIALLLALWRMKEFYPRKFEVCALSVNLGFKNCEDMYSPIEEFCSSLGIEYKVEKTQIAEIVFDERKEKNPCSLCAMMRRGALVNAAKTMNVTSIALGHHLDDVVETFMLSLTNEGRIGCFWPVTEYEDNGLRIIRPMIYAREYEVSAVAKNEHLPVVKNPCPEDGNTEREHIKNLLREFDTTNRGVYRRILSAIEKSGIDNWHN